MVMLKMNGEVLFCTRFKKATSKLAWPHLPLGKYMRGIPFLKKIRTARKCLGALQKILNRMGLKPDNQMHFLPLNTINVG